MKAKIAIAISGGIDSLMAAHILKEKGADLTGIHFISGYEKVKSTSEIYENIAYISDQLGIHIDVIDCHIPFKKKVVDYFTKTYANGETPNPCLVCNPIIKFGTILDQVKKNGAKSLATGHYARIIKDPDGKCHLYKGIDGFKDQSYFLAFLTEQQLKEACFPLGNYTKEHIKEMAASHGLSPITKEESQDICFIPDNNYGGFLENQDGFKSCPGDIINHQGKKVGSHQGLHRFTIGQRKGINCPAEKPYYVADIDTKQNVLVVGFKEELQKTTCRVTGVNWINRPAISQTEIFTKLRYRQKEIKATLVQLDDNEVILEFETPTFPITPGQGAVFYKGDEVLGGGFIKKQQSS